MTNNAETPNKIEIEELDKLFDSEWWERVGGHIPARAPTPLVDQLVGPTSSQGRSRSRSPRSRDLGKSTPCPTDNRRELSEDHPRDRCDELDPELVSSRAGDQSHLCRCCWCRSCDVYCRLLDVNAVELQFLMQTMLRAELRRQEAASILDDFGVYKTSSL